MIKLTHRRGAQKAIELGFIGVGQGGGRIADSLARLTMKKDNNDAYQAYTVAAINTNPMDLDVLEKVKHKIVLKGFENGAGRVPDRGEEAFEINKEMVIVELKRIFDKVDRITIIAGLGGGTGTGAFLPLIMAVDQQLQKPFSLLLTIPRLNESPVEKENAYEKFGILQENLQYLSGVAIIDNEQLFNDYLSNAPGKADDWLMNANTKIAEVIHEVNLVTKAFKPYRDKHFDAAEFANTLSAPGCITFGKAEIVIPATSDQIILAIKESLEKGRLAGGFDFTKARNIAVSMVAPEYLAKKVFDIKTLSDIEEGINEFTPKAKYRISAPYVDPLMKKDLKDNKLIIYSVVSGMPLPEKGRLGKLVEEVNSFVEEQDDALTGSLSFAKKKTAAPQKTQVGALANVMNIKPKEDDQSGKKKFSFLKNG